MPAFSCSRALLTPTLMALLATAIAGCGGSGAKSPTALTVPNHFPTRAALDKVAAAPIKPHERRAVVSVPEWQVDVGALPDSSVAETNLADVGADLRFTRELRCVARELGRLRAEHGGEGDERIQRFVLGACGLTSAANVSMYHLTGEVPAKISDDQLLKEWKKQLKVPPGFKGQSAGAWLTRKGDKAVMMIVAGKPDTSVSVSPGSAPGTVTVRGTTTSDAEYVLALVNQGDDGIAHCDPDRSVMLPQYAFNCTMRDGDPWAWIEVATRSSGRLLMRSTALVLARRDPQAAVELRRTTPAPSARLTDDQVATTVLEGVNRVRSSAKLTPVTLAPKQSAANGKLAAHFFDAETNADGETSDTVALGLLAGWDVNGTIRNGDFFGTLLTGAKDATTWIGYALEHPMGRLTLLDPTAQQIAIGSAPTESLGGLGVVVTTYTMFGSEDHQADVERVMLRLSQERAARRLPPIPTLGNLPTLADEARLVNAGQREPMAALDHALSAETERLGQSMRGWVILTHDLDQIPFPKELLAQGPSAPTALRVVVTHYRPENLPWGAYLIYLVAPAPTQQQVATSGLRSTL